MNIYEITIENQPKFQIQAEFYQSAMQKSRRIARDLFGLNAFTARLPIKIREIPSPTADHILTAEQMAYILGEPFLYQEPKPEAGQYSSACNSAHIPDWGRFCNDFNTIFEQGACTQ